MDVKCLCGNLLPCFSILFRFSWTLSPILTPSVRFIVLRTSRRPIMHRNIGKTSLPKGVVNHKQEQSCNWSKL
jgi:hypothetical protein